MDSLDRALLRAHELFLGELSDTADAELEGLLPRLVEAGFVHEEPWGDDADHFLWSFTEKGRKRTEELDASASGGSA
jgi:hypothetical protein